MPFQYYVAQMPSGSMNRTWLNNVGSNVSHSFTGAPTGSWNLVNVIPMSPINGEGGGTVMCYFVSGSY
jgi:hypothetical protein